jgi:hypothetical protein
MNLITGLRRTPRKKRNIASQWVSRGPITTAALRGNIIIVGTTSGSIVQIDVSTQGCFRPKKLGSSKAPSLASPVVPEAY